MINVRKLCVASVVFVGSLVGSEQVASFVAERATYRPPESGADQYTPEAYQAATKRLIGRLRDTNLVRAVGPDTIGRVVAVIVRKADLTTCEDLGRQMRALRGSLQDSDRFEAWTAQSDTGDVRTFLHIERIGRVRVRAVNVTELFASLDSLPTPAAIVLASDGELLAGVAHPLRFRNVRPNSFAHELGLLPDSALPKPPSGTPPHE